MQHNHHITQILNWLDSNQLRFIELADQIWHSPEIAWREFKSSQLQADFLKKE